MRVRKNLDIAGVNRIKGAPSMSLTDKCPDGRVTFPAHPCANCGCDYSIDEPGYMNCTFIASRVSEHTLEAIGEMMGITREGVRLIEIRALKKVRMAIGSGYEDDQASLYKQGSPSGENNISANGEGTESENKFNSVSGLGRRKLVKRRWISP